MTTAPKAGWLHASAASLAIIALAPLAIAQPPLKVHEWRSSAGTTINAAFGGYNPSSGVVTLLVPRKVRIDQLDEASARLSRRLHKEARAAAQPGPQSADGTNLRGMLTDFDEIPEGEREHALAAVRKLRAGDELTDRDVEIGSRYADAETAREFLKVAEEKLGDTDAKIRRIRKQIEEAELRFGLMTTEDQDRLKSIVNRSKAGDELSDHEIAIGLEFTVGDVRERFEEYAREAGVPLDAKAEGFADDVRRTMEMMDRRR